MKIDGARAVALKMPLKHAFETSYGRQTVRETVLVQLFGEGLCGWGEAAVSEEPDYCHETPAVSMLVLEKYLLPLVVGRDFAEPSELLRALDKVNGYPFSRTGVETAFIDLYCRSKNLPIHQWLGGTRKTVDAGISIGIEDDQGALFEQLDFAIAQGYRRLKLKIKPGHDVSVLGAVREYYPEIPPLMVDANCSYTMEHIDRLQSLDHYHLMMIEQPLAAGDLVEHAELQKRLRTHICLDESVFTMHELRAAIKLGSCRVVNIKFGRVGGLLAARTMAKEAVMSGIAVWCGGMLESGVGRAHNLALNSLFEFSLPGDISASDRYWEEDIIDPPVRVEEGVIALSDRPGIGYEVIENRVEHLKSAEVRVS